MAKLADGCWRIQEERRTISGYIDGTTFDPICESCFDMYDSLVKHIPFYPRLGHFGFKPERKKLSISEILQHYRNQKFNLDWSIMYTID
jgi:hypothetical protein